MFGLCTCRTDFLHFQRVPHLNYLPQPSSSEGLSLFFWTLLAGVKCERVLKKSYKKDFNPLFGGGIVALILREEQESTLELSWCLLYTMWPNSSFMKFHLKKNFKNSQDVTQYFHL